MSSAFSFLDPNNDSNAFHSLPDITPNRCFYFSGKSEVGNLAIFDWMMENAGFEGVDEGFFFGQFGVGYLLQLYT